MIQLEKLLNAPVNLVWEAITDKHKMKQWYFDLEEFKPEIGFEFKFKGGHEDGIQYQHICEITEAYGAAEAFEVIKRSWNDYNIEIKPNI